MFLRIPKTFVALGSGDLADATERGKHIKGVVKSRVNVDVGRNAGLSQVFDIVHRFCVERLGGGDEGVGRRQSCVVDSSCRRGIARDLIRKTRKVFFPAIVIAFCVSDGGMIVARGLGVLAIEHGI